MSAPPRGRLTAKQRRASQRRIPRTTADLIEAIEAHGYRVERRRGRSPHFHVRNRDGALVMVVAGTPSEYRSVMNTWTQFRRRAGIT